MPTDVEPPDEHEDDSYHGHIVVQVEVTGRKFRMRVAVALTGEEENPGVPMLMGLNHAVNAVLKDSQQAIVDRYPPLRIPEGEKH